MVEIKNGFVEPKTIEKPIVSQEIENIRKFAQRTKENNEGYLHEDFFATVLIPFHDNAFEPLTIDAGDEIYRISNEVSIKERKQMAVYPAEEGNIMILNRGWHASLEDWRKTWVAKRIKV